MEKIKKFEEICTKVQNNLTLLDYISFEFIQHAKQCELEYNIVFIQNICLNLFPIEYYKFK